MKSCPFCHEVVFDEKQCPNCKRVIIEKISDQQTNNAEIKNNKKAIEITRWIIVIPLAIIGSIVATFISAIPFIFLNKLITGEFVSTSTTNGSLYELLNISSAVAGFINAYVFIVLIYYIAPKHKENTVKILASIAAFIIFLSIKDIITDGNYTGINHDIVFFLTSAVMISGIDDRILFKWMKK